MKKKHKRRKKQEEKFETFILQDWDEIQEIEEMELEDLMKEFNIPEIDNLGPIDKPEELTYN